MASNQTDSSRNCEDWRVHTVVKKVCDNQFTNRQLILSKSDRKYTISYFWKIVHRFSYSLYLSTYLFQLQLVVSTTCSRTWIYGHTVDDYSPLFCCFFLGRIFGTNMKYYRKSTTFYDLWKFHVCLTFREMKQ